eukprot:312541-Chlamydomonas_euryale.AAC.1
MPTITLFSSRQQLQVREFVPGDNLLQSLSALANSSNVAPPYTFKVYNPDKDQLSLTSARCVGTQPLEAEVTPGATPWSPGVTRGGVIVPEALAAMQ